MKSLILTAVSLFICSVVTAQTTRLTVTDFSTFFCVTDDTSNHYNAKYRFYTVIDSGQSNLITITDSFFAVNEDTIFHRPQRTCLYLLGTQQVVLQFTGSNKNRADFETDSLSILLRDSAHLAGAITAKKLSVELEGYARFSCHCPEKNKVSMQYALIHVRDKSTFLYRDLIVPYVELHAYKQSRIDIAGGYIENINVFAYAESSIYLDRCSLNKGKASAHDRSLIQLPSKQTIELFSTHDEQILVMEP